MSGLTITTTLGPDAHLRQPREREREREMSITVTSQAELDAALDAHRDDGAAMIFINSPGGVWLTVYDTGSATVWAYGSATVRAYESATVRAYESATVWAYGSATVRAHGSTTVEAHGSTTVEAYGYTTVRAYESATVRAYNAATVRASAYVAIHRQSAHATVTGGVVIDTSALDLHDTQTWTDYTGATVEGDEILLYKAVDADLCAGHEHQLTEYPLGGTVTAPDWRDDHSCGGGLHASPQPRQALHYYRGETPPRMLAVTATRDNLRTLGTDKAKAPSLRVLREVSLDGTEITEEVTA